MPIYMVEKQSKCQFMLPTGWQKYLAKPESVTTVLSNHNLEYPEHIHPSQQQHICYEMYLFLCQAARKQLISPPWAKNMVLFGSYAQTCANQEQDA